MLPWLHKKSGGSISATVSDGKVQDEGAGHSPMHAAAEDLLNAIEMKDAAAVASALQAAIELGSMSEEQGEA